MMITMILIMIKTQQSFEREYGVPLFNISKMLNGLTELKRRWHLKSRVQWQLQRMMLSECLSQCQIGKEQDLIRSKDFGWTSLLA